MELFNVLRDDANLGSGIIDATHKWVLPGITCPHCDETWGNVGLEYPTVDLSFLPNEKEYRRSRPVGLDEFKRLSEPIAGLMGRNALLLPGTHFGPLIGNAKGRFADFAWLLPWTLLATKASLGWMRDRIAKIDGVPPELSFRGADRPALVELQLEPRGKLVQPPLTTLLIYVMRVDAIQDHCQMKSSLKDPRFQKTLTSFVLATLPLSCLPLSDL